MGFPRQEYWGGLTFPSPRDRPNPGIEPASPVSPALAGGFFTTLPPGRPSWSLTWWEAQDSCSLWFSVVMSKINTCVVLAVVSEICRNFRVALQVCESARGCTPLDFGVQPLKESMKGEPEGEEINASELKSSLSIHKDVEIRKGPSGQLETPPSFVIEPDRR